MEAWNAFHRRGGGFSGSSGDGRRLEVSWAWSTIHPVQRDVLRPQCMEQILWPGADATVNVTCLSTTTALLPPTTVSPTTASPTTSLTVPSQPSAQCSAHEACAALGLRGDCCPTTRGISLGCCDQLPPSNADCSAHEACAALGLGGNCCPTIDGVTLDCCGDALQSPAGNIVTYCVQTLIDFTTYTRDDDQTVMDNIRAISIGSADVWSGSEQLVPVNVDTASPPTASSTPASCSAYAECAGFGLVGNCCPTFQGVMLDCCGESVWPTGGAACRAHQTCATLGLDGYCCPTPDGVTLGCCEGVGPLLNSCRAVLDGVNISFFQADLEAHDAFRAAIAVAIPAVTSPGAIGELRMSMLGDLLLVEFGCDGRAIGDQLLEVIAGGGLETALQASNNSIFHDASVAISASVAAIGGSNSGRGSSDTASGASGSVGTMVGIGAAAAVLCTLFGLWCWWQRRRVPPQGEGTAMEKADPTSSERRTGLDISESKDPADESGGASSKLTASLACQPSNKAATEAKLLEALRVPVCGRASCRARLKLDL